MHETHIHEFQEICDNSVNNILFMFIKQIQHHKFHFSENLKMLIGFGYPGNKVSVDLQA